ERRGDDGALFEDEDDIRGARGDEQVGDRLGPLRVRDRVPPAVRDVQLRPFARGDARDEVRAVELGRADLEMRIAWPAQRSRAEERSTQVRATAAAAGEDTLRRPVERAMRSIEYARAMERLVRVRGSLDVKLVPRGLLES